MVPQLCSPLCLRNLPASCVVSLKQAESTQVVRLKSSKGGNWRGDARGWQQLKQYPPTHTHTARVPGQGPKPRDDWGPSLWQPFSSLSPSDLLQVLPAAKAPGGEGPPCKALGDGVQGSDPSVLEQEHTLSFFWTMMRAGGSLPTKEAVRAVPGFSDA